MASEDKEKDIEPKTESKSQLYSKFTFINKKERE